jgi:hypothetical protein
MFSFLYSFLDEIAELPAGANNDIITHCVDDFVGAQWIVPLHFQRQAGLSYIFFGFRPEEISIF